MKPRTAVALASAGVAYTSLQWLGRRYGATRAEHHGGLPGDQLCGDPQAVTTHAITIRSRIRLAPWWVAAVYQAALVPADLVMSRQMLRGVRARAERSPSVRSTTEPRAPRPIQERSWRRRLDRDQSRPSPVGQSGARVLDQRGHGSDAGSAWRHAAVRSTPAPRSRV